MTACTSVDFKDDNYPPDPIDTTYLGAMIGRWQVISSSVDYVDSLGSSQGYFYTDTVQYRADLVFERPDSFYIDVQQKTENPVIENLLLSNGKFSIFKHILRLDGYDYVGYVSKPSWTIQIQSQDTTHITLEDVEYPSGTEYPYVRTVYKSINLIKK